MSDSFIAILGMGFLLGITVTLVIIGAIYGSDNQGQLHNDSDVRLYIPVRDRCRRGDNGRDKPLEQEEVRKVLSYFRIGATSHERQALDQILDGMGVDND